MIGFRKKKRKEPEVPYELIEQWQNKIFGCLGITPNTDNKTIKDCCRIVMLESSRLYCNIERLEAGMKPLGEKKEKGL